MSNLIDTPKRARHVDGVIEVEMVSGQMVRFPVAGSTRLARGTDEELSDIEVSPFGLHWPRLDEDLSIRGILEGRFG